MRSHPTVSILIAARNEEAVLARLLTSLAALEYPTDKLQILIGNDDSTDGTQAIIAEFEANYSHFQAVPIQKDYFPSLKGKAQVLAQLAHGATGKYWLYTDADMELPVSWVTSMIEPFEQDKKVGVVVGVTTFRPTSLLAACMGLEWLSAIWVMRVSSLIGIPSTGMGNNMGVSAEAYWATGGYENMPFSIVEDYALYEAILAKGFSYHHHFSAKVKGFTLPPARYFEQRKRWIAGGLSSDSSMKYLSIFQALSLPLLLLVAFLWPQVGLLLVVVAFVVHFLMANIAAIGANSFELLPYTLFYPFYMVIGWFIQFIYYLLPTQLVWKDRAY